jgi:hypothetical protein
VEARDLGPDDALAELSHFGAIYRRLEDELGDHTPTGRFFYRWRTMQASSLTPVLMWVHSHEDEIGDVVPILQMFESWLVRRMVCRSSTKGYSHFLHTLLKSLSAGDVADAPTTIADHLLSAEAQGTEWPTDSQVTTAVLELPIYRQLVRARLRFLLEAIEDHQRGAMVEEKCPTGLTVEHVLPQHWETNWPIGDDPDGQRTVRRNDLVHTLGNLSLVTKSLNPALSNSAWTDKRRTLREHSVLLLSDHLLDRDVWDEEAIVERGKELADAICEIWPRPT